MSTFRKSILSMTRQSGWKLAVIFGFSALLVIGLLLARANPLSAAKAAGSPTIANDKADYQPGATVTLTGAGWASGEAVHIFVNDSVGNTWSLNSNPDPVADTNGSFTYSFSLPSTFIANYTATATGPTSGTATTMFTDNICPSSPTDSQIDPNPDPHVSATFTTTSSSTAKYTLSSVNLSPSGGIPGLIDYCVYTSPQPANVMASYDSWTATNGTPFSFSRPGGNPTNVPLDGNTYTIGTATWSGNVPASQTFVLHINDPAFCQAYNGSSTCFVKPGLVAQDLTVTKTATPSFTKTYTWGITKSVAPPTKQTIAVGGTATFNYTVAVTHDAGTDSNWAVNGTITVKNPNGFEDIVANVSDAIDNGGLCTVTGGSNVTVPAGKSVTLDYICTYSSAPSPLAGTNTATASWDKATYFTPDGSATGTASADFSKATVTVNNGTITVVDDKTDPSNPVTLGTASYTQTNPIDFTYVLSFSGKSGTCTDYTNTATIKETSQTASQTVTVCAAKDLSVSKTATPTFTRTFKWGIKKSVDNTQINIAQGGSATFTYTVTVTHDAGTDSGWTVSGTITVSNPNNWEPITLTGVTDSINDGGACSITSGNPTGAVPASGSVTLGYTCSYTSAPSPLTGGTNTATASWDKTAASTPDGSATGTAPVDFSTPTTLVDGSVDVTDSLGGSLRTVKYTDPSPTTITYSHTFSGDTAGTCTSHDNTATFTTSDTHTTGSSNQTVTVCVGADLAVSKTASTGFMRTYIWGITKKVDQTQQNIAAGGTATFNYTVSVTHDAGTDSGWTASGTITVSNPNDWEAITATITDAVNNEPNASCMVTGGTNLTLAASGNPGDTATVPYTCTYSAAPASNSETNTATASWDKTAVSTPDGSATGTAPVNFSTPTKVVDGSVSVTDSLGGTLRTVSFTDPSPTTFMYPVSFPGVGGHCTDYTNTATFTTSDTGATGSAGQKVTVCVGLDLSVSKTATPSFTRTYAWGITKSVDKNEIDIANGGSATFNYKVNVTHDGGTDSAWTVSGTITVNNPNDWEAITANVSDAVDNGGSCTVTNGIGVTVPKSGSAQVSYSCTFSSGSSGKNTATATWDKATYFTPDASASSDPVPFAFTTPTTIVDGSVSVSDTLGGSLGTVSYTNPSPTTFMYPLPFSGVGGTCTAYPNTATFTTSDTSTTGSASQTVKVCVGVDLTVSKTATTSFTRTYNWSIAKSVDHPEIDIAKGSSATFNYAVVVNQTGFTDSGWQVAGTITVKNPNDWEAITVNVGDIVDNGGACIVTGGTGVSVPASSSKTLNYTCTYASQPSYNATATNTATATWNSGAFFTPDGSASGSAGFTFSTPTTTSNKTITVTDTFNSMTTTLGLLTATDATPFATATYTYSHTVSGNHGTCTSYDNTAKIVETGQSSSQTVKVCVGVDLTVSKTATPTFTRTYNWSIAKAVDHPEIDIAKGSSATFNFSVTVSETGFTDSGWQVAGTITVTNPNDWEAITADVSDAIDGGGICTVSGGTGVSVPASGSKTLNYTCTYAAAPNPSSGTNMATASWDSATFFTPDVSASGTATFAFATPTTRVNQTITVTDSYAGALGTVTATDTPPFTSKTFTYSRTEKGTAGTCTTYPNTAKIVETSQSSSQTVKVCVGADLTVSKTAATSFTRTYAWSIKKAVDKTLVKQVGGTVTFNFSVTVSETGFTDSGWQVAGTITVTNPNDWEAITANVTDTIDNNGNCSVTGGSAVSVPAGKSVTLPYSCTYTSAPSPSSGANTATATWNSRTFFTPDSSALGIAGYAFGAPTTKVNQTITVTDSYKGTLGTATATDSTPFTSKTFTYARTVNVPQFGCKTYPNTATIVETGLTASASVTVCGPVQTGALTMGFWQNKNGQAIITGGKSTSGVCNSGTWLRQYAPFQDLSSTATCSQVATYVYNIIKAANASGSSMNPMLKAQMLATALDVYFGGGPGGNPINAPVVIGGVTIDLTKICAMIDGSSGTATCNGSFENVSSAFGGATSLTVSQMLAFAASQSNVGGSTWYGNVKATQQLAKDAFDAINNQVAFAP